MRKILAIILVIVSVVMGVFSYRVSLSSLDSNTTISAAPQKYVGLNEYDAFLNSGMVDLNSNFVKWEDISFLGEFDYMQISLGGMYEYHFKSSGMSIVLKLYLNSDEWQDNHPWTKGRISVPYSSQMDSMRYYTSDAPKNNSVKIIRHSIAYRYSKDGNLSKITWVENGIEYVLNVDGYFSDYPDDDTVIGRLLSSDNAVAKSAVKELEAQLPGSKIQQPIPKDTISAVLAIASGLCLATAIVLFVLEIRKSMLKKKSAEET